MSESKPLPNLTKLMLEELVAVGRTDAIVKVIRAEYSELVKEQMLKATDDLLIPPKSFG